MSAVVIDGKARALALRKEITARVVTFACLLRNTRVAVCRHRGLLLHTGGL